MNVTERKRQTLIAHRLIEEVLIDVLAEAGNEGGNPMDAGQIAGSVGMRWVIHSEQAMLFHAKQLERQGRIVNVGTGYLPKYRLPASSGGPQDF